MSALCLELIHAGSYIILDAKFASKQLIEKLRQHKLHIITRVRINAVGKRPLPPPPLKCSRGRPRIWGESVKLRNLFDRKDSFRTETLLLGVKLENL
ncbi:MAG: transposase [Microcoleaceae cyanobacterium]